MTKEQQMQLKDEFGMLQQDCWVEYQDRVSRTRSDEQFVLATREVDDLIPGKTVQITVKMDVLYI